MLGYATGGGNYKVQDIASRRVFVSCDVIFEEGKPHRTTANVGEQIPLFDMNMVPNPLADEPPSDNRAHTDTHSTPESAITDVPKDPVDQRDIPVIPIEPC